MDDHHFGYITKLTKQNIERERERVCECVFCGGEELETLELYVKKRTHKKERGRGKRGKEGEKG